MFPFVLVILATTLITTIIYFGYYVYYNHNKPRHNFEFSFALEIGSNIFDLVSRKVKC